MVWVNAALSLLLSFGWSHAQPPHFHSVAQVVAMQPGQPGHHLAMLDHASHPMQVVPNQHAVSTLPTGSRTPAGYQSSVRYSLNTAWTPSVTRDWSPEWPARIYSRGYENIITPSQREMVMKDKHESEQKESALKNVAHGVAVDPRGGIIHLHGRRCNVGDKVKSKQKISISSSESPILVVQGGGPWTGCYSRDGDGDTFSSMTNGGCYIEFHDRGRVSGAIKCPSSETTLSLNRLSAHQWKSGGHGLPDDVIMLHGLAVPKGTWGTVDNVWHVDEDPENDVVFVSFKGMTVSPAAAGADRILTCPLPVTLQTLDDDSCSDLYYDVSTGNYSDDHVTCGNNKIQPTCSRCGLHAQTQKRQAACGPTMSQQQKSPHLPVRDCQWNPVSKNCEDNWHRRHRRHRHHISLGMPE